MSGAERTGATEAQIEAAAKRYHVWESSDPDTYRPWEKLGRRTQECLKEIAEEMLSAAVPPGSRIIDAEDAAAIRRVVECFKYKSDWLDADFESPEFNTAEHHLIGAIEAVTDDDVARLARLGQG
jgi:hypothetical protein